MNFPFYIAKRYLFTKNSNNAINIITLIASFGVIVGSLALFIVLSGFSGLSNFTNTLLEVSDPDIKITTTKGKSFLLTDSLQHILNNDFEIASFSKVIEERVFLKYQNKEQIAQIKGVDTHYNKVTKIDSVIIVGQWLHENYQKTAVIGEGISFKLSIGNINFQPIEIYVPKPGKGYVLNPNAAFSKVTAQIVGIYDGTEEFENKFAFVNLPLAQKLLRYKPNQITGIEIQLKNALLSDKFRDKLQNQLGNAYKVQTKVQLNALFYRVINTESFISYLIFTLIVIIALFNVIGAIIMMIIDKRQNLKTLYNLGATLKEIKRIFVLQGFLLTFVGMCIGVSIGIVLVFLQQKFSWFMITKNLPYPVEFRISNLVIVIGTIIVLGFFAAKIASARISTSFIEK